MFQHNILKLLNVSARFESTTQKSSFAQSDITGDSIKEIVNICTSAVSK